MPTAPAAQGHNKPPSLTEILKDRYKDLFDRKKKWLARAQKADLNPVTIADCEKLDALFREGRDLANDADSARKREGEEPLRMTQEINALFNGEIIAAVGNDPKKPGLALQINQASATKRLAIARAEQAATAAAAQKAQEESDRLAARAQRQEDKGQTRAADVTQAQADGAASLAASLEAQATAPISEATRGRTAAGGSVSVSANLVCENIKRDDIDLNALKPYFKHDDIVAAVNAALKLKAFTTFPGAIIVEKAIGRVRG